MTLKEFLEAKIAAMETAVALARHDMERRLESMNEFREQLRSQASTFVGRVEFDLAVDRIMSDIKILTQCKDKMEGKASQQLMLVSLVIGVTSLILGLIGLLLRYVELGGLK